MDKTFTDKQTRTRRRGRWLLQAVPVAALALLIGLHPTLASSQPGGDPGTEPIPVLDFDDPAKAMVVALHFTGRYQATLESAKVVDGRAPARAGNPPLLRVDLAANSGALAEAFNAYHPLWAFEHGPGGHHRRVLAEATGHLVFPFSPHLASMKVQDIGRKESGPRERHVITVDLHPAIRDYCLEHRADPDCRTDLKISQTHAPEPAAAGEPVTYTLTVTNGGPNPAHAVRVVDTLPAGLTYQSDTGGCAQAPANTLTCDLGLLLPGASRQIAVTARVDADVVCTRGGPVDVVNTATVANLAGEDSAPADNTATETARVVDNTVRGGAFGERAKVRTIGGIEVGSGPLPVVESPATGCGAFSESRTTPSVGLAGLLSVEGLTAAVDGDRSGPDAFVHAAADVGKADLGLGTVRLEGVHSECRSDPAGTSGSVTLGKLVVGGTTATNQRPAPNTRIPILGVGTLILNEQISAGGPASGGRLGNRSLTVNAVRLSLTGGLLGSGDIVLAQSRCSIEGPHVD